MNPSIKNLIGLHVRELRRRQHRSQEELSVWLRAFRVPVTRAMIANWETGRSVIPAHYLPILAYMLQAEFTEILPTVTVKDLVTMQTKRNRYRP